MWRTGAVSQARRICPERCCAKRRWKDSTFSACVSAIDSVGTSKGEPGYPTKRSASAQSEVRSQGSVGARWVISNCKFGRIPTATGWLRWYVH